MNRYLEVFKPLAQTLAIGLVLAVMTGCSGGSGSSSAGISLLAGNVDGDGNLDGTGAKAGFNFPRGLAVDSTGTNLYVADRNNSIIRKIVIATGVVTTFAGSAGNSGYVDDPDPKVARFSHPTSLAIDGSDNLYVVEGWHNYTIRKITSAGAVTTIAGAPRSGTGGGTQKDADGTGAAAGFGPMAGIAVDNTGTNLYVSNSRGDTIRKIVIATGVVTTFEGLAHSGCCGGGNADDPLGLGSTATFHHPHGLAIDSAGNVYVADKQNNTIRKITPAGVVSTLAGSGSSGYADGTGVAASFYYPNGLAVDSAGNLYVADQYNSVIRQVTPAGAVTTLAGSAGVLGSADGTGAAASFNFPTGLAIDKAGTNLYVGDHYSQTIRRIVIATGKVTTIAGSPGMVFGSADGSKSAASFYHTKGAALDGAGNLYVADGRNCTIRKITSAGEVSTFIGTAGTCAGTDGTGAWASFTRPLGLTIDSSGNLYVADRNNGSVRKVTPARVVTTLATGFNTPHDLAVDSAGNVYVADSTSNISKITPAGTVSIYASGVSGAHGLAFDSAGNLYVAEGNRSGPNIINKIDSVGTVTLFAGSGTVGSADGIGAAASFNEPHGLVIDSNDNLYIADRRNNTIRKITPAGVVTTVAGVAGEKGFRSGALPGILAGPRFLAIKGKTLYVTARHGVVKVALP